MRLSCFDELSLQGSVFFQSPSRAHYSLLSLLESVTSAGFYLLGWLKGLVSGRPATSNIVPASTQNEGDTCMQSRHHRSGAKLAAPRDWERRYQGGRVDCFNRGVRVRTRFKLMLLITKLKAKQTKSNSNPFRPDQPHPAQAQACGHCRHARLLLQPSHQCIFCREDLRIRGACHFKEQKKKSTSVFYRFLLVFDQC